MFLLSMVDSQVTVHESGTMGEDGGSGEYLEEVEPE